MLKIDYLSSGIKETQYDEYLSCFDIASNAKKPRQIVFNNKIQRSYNSVKEILIAPIETLLGYTDKLSKIKLTDGQTKTLKEIFNYDNPDFFIKKSAIKGCIFLPKSGLS